MNFNLNDYVKVKLNDYGRQIYREKIEKVFENINLPQYKFEEKIEENGWSTWQLWELMETFGAAVNTGKLPFETTEIKLCNEVVQEKADMWDALMSCDRIRFIGGAKLGDPTMQHAGFDFWARHPDTDDADSRARFIDFVKTMRF